MSRGFRRRDARTTWEMHYGPSMTPMCDVVLVILIYFMASTSFAGAEWFLKAGIPKEGKSESKQPEGADPLALPPARFDISLVTVEGKTVARGQGVGEGPLEGLEAKFAELARGLSGEELVVVIRPEAGVPYPDVIRAQDAAMKAGIQKVGLMDVKPGP